MHLRTWYSTTPSKNILICSGSVTTILRVAMRGNGNFHTTKTMYHLPSNLYPCWSGAQRVFYGEVLQQHFDFQRHLYLWWPHYGQVKSELSVILELYFYTQTSIFTHL